MQLRAVTDRLARLVDAFVDGALDKDTFNERKRQLLEEQAVLREALTRETVEDTEMSTELPELFELANSAQQSYFRGTPAARRELVLKLSSNRTVARKDVAVEPHPLVRLIQKRRLIQ